MTLIGIDEPTSTFNPTAVKFANDLTEWLTEHEREHHDGRPCELERGNILAWLAHRIGYGPDTFTIMTDRLLDYHRNCPGAHTQGRVEPCDQ